MKIKIKESHFERLVGDIINESQLTKNVDHYKSVLKQSNGLTKQLDNYFDYAKKTKNSKGMDDLISVIYVSFNPQRKSELINYAKSKTKNLLNAYSELKGFDNFDSLKKSIG